MCWTTIYDSRTIRHTANKDIKVFKIVQKLSNDSICPYFFQESNIIYGYIERKGKRKKYRHDKEPMDTYLDSPVNSMYPLGHTISHGFHSYDRKRIHLKKFHKEDACCSGISVYYRKNFLHKKLPFSIQNYYKESTCEFGYMMMKCIIPKGAKYYLNEQGEYVSDSIKITGFKKI